MTPTLTAPDPDIYPNVPAEQYHAWGAVSSSRLKHMTKSPAHYKYAIDNPDDFDTAALALGRAYHDAILLPNEFIKNYTVKPAELRRNSNAYKEWKESIGDLIEMDICDYDTCIGIRDAIHGHAEANALLQGKGCNEASIVWIDPETGLKCKGRIDRFTRHEFKGGYPERTYPMSCHVDFKGTVDASPAEFTKSIARYGYHRQAAFYLDGTNELKPANRVFAIVAFEKKPPYAVGVYYLDDEAIEQGRREYRRALNTLKRCIDADTWPSYTQTIQPIGVPGWAIDPETKVRL